MPIISQILCDGCQAVKKQTNHLVHARHQRSPRRVSSAYGNYPCRPLQSGCRWGSVPCVGDAVLSKP